MNPVDLYLQDGCGRCKLYKTEQCKVHNWSQELKTLREIVQECNLSENLKWSVPVYTHNNKNIVIISAFKEYCSLSFFKGSLINDTENILQKQGESSQSARLLKFTNNDDILKIKDLIKSYIKQAIDIELSGAKVEFKKDIEQIPSELQDKLDNDPVFKQAFTNLTPSKQRGYIIYFSQPKQSQTRINRIDSKYQDIILGKGLNDR